MEETVRPARVLVVDDEPSVLRALEVILRKKGHEVVALDSPIAATQRLATEDFDVAMLDIRMPELSGIELLNAVKHRRPEIEVIMMTGHATVDTALAAMKAGAHDYLIKPFIEKPDDVEHVAYVVARAAERKRLQDRNRELETRLEALETTQGLVGTSGPMREVGRMIEAVAYSAATVLVQGESGTGKELVARALHARSPRRAQPVRGPELRRAHRDPARERALRPREGGLHRRQPRPQGALRVGQRRHHLPRRDRRHPALHPGPPAARAAGGGDQEGRVHRPGQGRRARHRRHPPRPAQAGPGREVPRGPLLPAERHRHPAPAAARPARRRPAAGPPLRAPLLRPAGQEGADARPRGHRAALRLPVAGQRARARERHRAGRGALPRRLRPAHRPAPVDHRADRAGPARGRAARATTPSCSPRATPPPRTTRCGTSRSATSRR